MKRIKIVLGTYGYMKNGVPPVESIDKDSEPIEVADTEAERLVNLGVAAYASEKLIAGHLDAGQFADCSMKELQKLAKDMGLKANGSKEELIARITAKEVYASEEPDTKDAEDDIPEEPDNDEPPVLDAVDPE